MIQAQNAANISVIYLSLADISWAEAIRGTARLGTSKMEIKMAKSRKRANLISSSLKVN